MKKLMVSTIILLPLLILLIMLVSGAIMSLVTHIYVESIEFVQDDTLILVLSDESNQPSAKCDVNILPLKASNRGVIFEIEDEAVAKVDENGVVTAKDFGETYVSVQSEENKAAVDQRKVLVTDNKVHRIEIQPFTDNMYTTDKSQYLTAKVIPAEAKDQTIIWTSSDETVATVSPTGEVVCKGAGEVTITATSGARPEISDDITLHCFQALNGISLEGKTDDEPITIFDRDEDFPEVVPEPSNATYTVQYASSNEDVATVDENGHITFKGAGYVEITATASDARDHSYSKTVKYHCTDGYFTGALFSRSAYTLDYDDELATPQLATLLALNIVPDVAYRQIVSVTYALNNKTYSSEEGEAFPLISFDKATNTFKLNSVPETFMLGEVTITVNAVKYSRSGNKLVETKSDNCTVNVTRKTQSVTFYNNGDGTNDMSITTVEFPRSIGVSMLTLSNNNPATVSGISILPYPLNHTDKLSCSVTAKENVVTVDMAKSLLTFTAAGTADLSVNTEEGTPLASMLKVQCIKTEPQDKVTSITPPAEGEPAPAPINIVMDENVGSSILEVTAPDGTTPVYKVEGDDIIELDETEHKVTAKKGGFATITITFVPNAAAAAVAADEPITITILYYIDKLIQVSNISFETTDGETIENDMWTEKDSIDFNVVLSGITADYMEGKQLFLQDKAENLTELTNPEEKEDGRLVYKVTNDALKAFAGATDLKLQAVLKYNERAKNYYKALKDQYKDFKEQIFDFFHTVHSSHGKLNKAPVVKIDGAEFDKGNVEFNDIGKQVVLDITATLDPKDFTLTKEKIYFSNLEESAETDKFKYAVNVENNTHATVTLTSLHTMSQATPYTLNVAGHTFTLNVKINAPAKNIALKFGGKDLQNGAAYYAMSKSLAFTATMSRDDNNTITDDITCTLENKNNNGTSKCGLSQGYNYNITLSELAAGDYTLTVMTGENDSVKMSVTIKRYSLKELADFAIKQYYVEYPHDSKVETLDAVEFEQGAVQSIALPKQYQGAINICVDIPLLKDLVGKAGSPVNESNLLDSEFDLKETDEELTDLFGIELPEGGWTSTFYLSNSDKLTVKYSVASPQIINESSFNNQNVKFTFNGVEVTISLSKNNIALIEMKGFDSEDKSNGGDVYKGYQQVRVFAKHSDYGKENQTDVDYVRVPVEVLEDTVFKTKVDPRNLTWKFTKNVKNVATDLYSMTYAQENKFTFSYGGADYEVVYNASGSSTLQLKSGETIAENGKYISGKTQVPWMDVHYNAESADGYVDIYFGNFKGLSETDVQMDYFGNFDDKESWSEPSADKRYSVEGKQVDPSEGAFSFLRIEAGDGSQGGVNRHFNFNVLEDSALVNVFNATGYYAHSKIVLHNNLYGGANSAVQAKENVDPNCNENELKDGDGKNLYTEAKNEDLVLDYAFTTSDGTNTGKMAKNTVFGNGYQINLNALNTMIINDNERAGCFMNNNNHTENAANHTQFTNIYNVMLKGRNDTEKVVSTRMGVYFDINNAYYSTIQNYGKLYNGSLHAKNTIFRNAAMAGIELWSDRNNAASPSCIDYLENVTIVNAMRGIIMENNPGHTLYIKGYLDALNYNSFNGIKNLASEGMIDDGAVFSILASSMAFNRQSVDKYMEWFGCNYDVSLQRGQTEGGENFFVNPMIIDTSHDGKTKRIEKGSQTTWAMGTKQFYIDDDGSVVWGTEGPNYTYPKDPGNTWVWTEYSSYTLGVGGIINVWDESQDQPKYVNIKDNPEKSSFATPLSGLDHIDPRFVSEDTLMKYKSLFSSAYAYGNYLITGYTFDNQNTVDGGLCTVTPDNEDGSYDFQHFNAKVSRPNLGKLFTSERDIRLLCEYVDIDNNGNPILNTDHILWHMQRAHRDVNIIKDRTQDHSEALKESLKNAKAKYGWDGKWPDGTTLQQALDAEQNAAAQAAAEEFNDLIATAVLPGKEEYAA